MMTLNGIAAILNFVRAPWVTEEFFNRNEDPYFTGEQVIKIDNTIMEYKKPIQRLVDVHNDERECNGQSPDWFVIDLHLVAGKTCLPKVNGEPFYSSPS